MRDIKFSYEAMQPKGQSVVILHNYIVSFNYHFMNNNNNKKKKNINNWNNNNNNWNNNNSNWNNNNIII